MTQAERKKGKGWGKKDRNKRKEITKKEERNKCIKHKEVNNGTDRERKNTGRR